MKKVACPLFRIDEALTDPQVAHVAIATPAETHGELVRQALLAGNDVLVEKPFPLTPIPVNELFVALPYFLLIDHYQAKAVRWPALEIRIDAVLNRLHQLL